MALQIYDPTNSQAKSRTIAYVARPKTLAGLRIGLVDNTKHNSDQLLLRIGALLERDHGAKTHIIRKKKNASTPAHAEMIEEYKAKCDVIVAGIGD